MTATPASRTLIGCLAVVSFTSVACDDQKPQACVTADGAARFAGVTSTSPACGVVNTELVDKTFAIGVMNNAQRAPQAAPLLHLRFNQAPDGENDAVVAVAVPVSSIDIDGATTTDSEWAGVPFKDVSLRPPSEVIPDGLGLNPDGLTTIDHGISLVRVWAAYDSENIYMRLRWRDDTRNDVPARWTYTATGWKTKQAPIMSAVDPSIDHPLLANEAMDSSQDEVTLMFNKNSHDFEARNGCGGMCHLEGIPAGQHPNGIYNRGGRMKTTTPGEVTDSWVWRAGTSNPLGLADDMYWHCGGATPATSCDFTTSSFDIGDAGERTSYSVAAASLCTGLSGNVSVDPTRLASPPAPALDAVEEYVGNWYVEAPSPSSACIDHGPSAKPDDGTSAFIYEAGSPYIGERGAEATPVAGTDVFDVGTTISGQIFRNIESDTATCARCSVKARGKYDDTQKWWDVEIKRSLVAAELAYDVDFTIDELQ